MRRVLFWLRWSGRDLRRRWLQVLATALVISIGVAIFAGLGGMRAFRDESTTRSFQALRFHDVRVTLPEGDFAPVGRLAATVRAAGPDAPLAAVQERLVVPTQLDGRPSGKELLTPGQLIGVAVAPGPGEQVDLVRAARGRGLNAGDAERAVAVLDYSYAKFYELPPSGRLRLPGGQLIDYVGQGQSPEYFLITSDTGFGGESTRGVLYAPLAAVQRISGRRDQVNEVVLRLARGSEPPAAKTAIERVVQQRFPGSDVVLGTDEPTSTILYGDAESDQQMMTFFGLLVLVGASIAAFNLVTRTVEAERREIGIGMALGLPPSRLALRPLLLGAEIAFAGALLGALLSWWLAGAFAGVMKEFLPLPYWGQPLRAEEFARGAAIGFLLPFAATIWPVWRGVRVPPVEAIQVSERSARGGMVRAGKRLRLPGGTVAQMPWRNSLRTPRRTLLAVVALGAVLGALISLLGVMDSFSKTIDTSRTELVGAAPGRLSVVFNEPTAAEAPVVRSLAGAAGVRSVDPRLDLPATVARGGASVPVLLTVNARAGAVWAPQFQAGRAPSGAGEIALAPKAAEDLGVGLGEPVALQAAGRDARGETVLRSLTVRVTGLTNDPFRVFAYADAPLAGALGLAGVANAASVMPAPGSGGPQVQRALAASPLVATTRPVTADSDALSDTLEQFQEIVQMAAVGALALAVLMAFNLAGISLDERRREYATMFAFGVPVGRALRIAAAENFVVGVLGTLLGFGIGLAAMSWMIGSLFESTWPEIGMVLALSTETIVVAVFVGVVMVTLTPYLLARRLTRMDIPSTLRVVE